MIEKQEIIFKAGVSTRHDIDVARTSEGHVVLAVPMTLSQQDRALISNMAPALGELVGRGAFHVQFDADEKAVVIRSAVRQPPPSSND